MRHFSYLSDLQTEGIFYKKPAIVTKSSSKEILQYSLGATLYMPSTRHDIAKLVISRKYSELCSMVLCLEDAIGDNEVEMAEIMVINHIHSIYKSLEENRISTEELPLIFLRVRSPEQILRVGYQLGEALNCVTGFVFPKFSVFNAAAYLENLTTLINETNIMLYGMPIFETPEVLDKETRFENLLEIKKRLESYKEYILNIRIGATDLCGLYGIRRNYHTTIYDISIIRDFITDLINFFARDYVISGPVWEYFKNPTTRILKPQLRESPFTETYGDKGLEVRAQLLNDYGDGLIKETLLDLANGLTGKTVIHPDHVKIVHSLNVVTKEEYQDALTIINNSNGSVGVVKSEYSNKMNEIKPHYKWAEKVLKKSEIYGVYHENHNFFDLLAESTYTSNLV
ncbi:HpcH/HpaI aldolase/citrate lyase family protein [Bacillus sp. DJP31]|uniref:HpcH/HpaI aldolase/citrate lyase family protein n=1 Tax=Bacillus sp. DJP31 TaxID=3409789 RepID=UPI003BB61488